MIHKRLENPDSEINSGLGLDRMLGAQCLIAHMMHAVSEKGRTNGNILQKPLLARSQTILPSVLADYSTLQLPEIK